MAPIAPNLCPCIVLVDAILEHHWLSCLFNSPLPLAPGSLVPAAFAIGISAKVIGDPKRRDTRAQRSRETGHLRSKGKPSLILVLTAEIQHGVEAVVETSTNGSLHECLICKVVREIERRAAKEHFSVRHETPIGQIEPWSNVVGALVNRSEEHTSELQSLRHLVCRLLLEKK